ncbi:hypothetical protein SLS58_007421 [Diplodia intermedia]|uniref:Uncharacterized protein n=1 Tax=Diplodia intermedia TaxID=856260 RepID=A0ABR3TKL9_9PEZI
MMENASSCPSDIEPTNQNMDIDDNAVGENGLNAWESFGRNVKSEITEELPVPSHPQRPFPWDKLPGELKNKIYEFALVVPHPLTLRGLDSAADSRVNFHMCCVCDRSECDCGFSEQVCATCDHCWHRFAPSLLRANKEIYREALPILYKNVEIILDRGKNNGVFLGARRFSVNRHFKKFITDEYTHWTTYIKLIGFDLHSITITCGVDDEIDSVDADIESKAWNIFRSAYWYLKSLDAEKVWSVIQFTGPWTFFDDTIFQDEVEEAVRERIVELLEDRSPELRERVMADQYGAYIDPSSPFSPPTTWPEIYDWNYVWERGRVGL